MKRFKTRTKSINKMNDIIIVNRRELENNVYNFSKNHGLNFDISELNN